MTNTITSPIIDPTSSAWLLFLLFFSNTVIIFPSNNKTIDVLIIVWLNVGLKVTSLMRTITIGIIIMSTALTYNVRLNLPIWITPPSPSSLFNIQFSNFRRNQNTY